jgi:uncharacterized membrane protein
MMSDLVVITYPDEQRAEDVVALLHRLQTLQEVDVEDVVLATRNNQGEIHFQHGRGRPLSGHGAAAGGAIGAVAGLAILNPLAGAALGAGIGAARGKRPEYGIADSFVQEVSAQLAPGTAAVFALVRSMANRDQVVSEVYKYGGTLLQTSLPPDAEARLRADLKHLQDQDRPAS